MSEPGRGQGLGGPGFHLGLVLLAAVLMLNGCAAVLLGGAAVGAAAIYDRRDPQTVLDDQEIELLVMRDLDATKDLKGRSRISVTSYNRTVLLTGQAQTPSVAAHASGRVSRMPKVERVIDEVQIGPNISLTQEAKDVWITSQAKVSLLDVRVAGFDATRVKVVTEDAVVYLLGLVSPEEADAAAEKISFVPGVQRVVKLFEYNDGGGASLEPQG